MRFRTLIFSITMIGLVASCGVQALNPFYSEQNLIFDEDLVGNWTIKKGNENWSFEAIGDSHYRLRHQEKKTESSLIVHLFKINDQLFLDFTADTDQETDESYMGIWHYYPVHSAAKLNLKKNKATIQFFGGQGLEELIEDPKQNIGFAKTADEFMPGILTGSTNDIQKLLQKNMEDDSFFADALELVKE
jgi:hypothetical protein